MELKRIRKECLNPNYFNQWVIDTINDFSHKYEVFYGGGGSGKSYGATQKIIIKAVANKRKVLFIRKVAVTIKDSIYDLVKTLLLKMDVGYKENKTEMRITLNNGSVFLFKGLEDVERIKSIVDITDIFIEEASEITLEDFTQLDIRLRPPEELPNPQIYLCFNPISKANWTYNYWFETKQNKAKIIKTTYKDNKFLTKDYVNTLENLINVNPTFYKVYALGEYASLDKNIFTNWQIKDFEVTEVPGEVVVGLDFGYVDPIAIVGCKFNTETKELYIFDDFKNTELDNLQIFRQLCNMGLNKSLIVADSAEPKSIHEIKSYGCYRIKESPKGKDSVIHGIRYLQQYKIYIHPNCKHTIEAIENYSWKKDKKTGEYLEEPDHTYSHLMDAIRYASTTYWKNNKLRSIDRKLLGV